MNKKFMVAAALVASLVASTALAADLPAPGYKGVPVAPTVYAAPFSWTGFYVGGEAGWIGEATSGPFTNAAGAGSGPYSIDHSDALLGGFVGYNQLIGTNFVVGVEGDFNGVLGGSGKQTTTFNPGGGIYDITAKQTWLGDVRARVGYAAGNALLYVAGGAAFGDVNTTYAFTGAAPFLSNTTTRIGWTLGGGVDYAFTNNMFARIEYRYTDLGSRSFLNNFQNTADNVHNHSNAVLVGIGYKF